MTGPSIDGLDAIISRFEIAAPEMLEDRRLLKRVDTKFLLPSRALIWLLAGVAHEYRTLGSADRALARYRTVYYDTPELQCFHDHRRGRRPRHKIRVRDYLDRQLGFFEVKTKRANGETEKYRTPLVSSPDLDDQARRLVALHTSLPFDRLAPTMTVEFWRLTLLSIRDTERVTIDVGLDFSGSTSVFNLDDIAIVEIKQPALRRQTPIMQALHTHRFYPTAGSKYCTTLVMSHPGIPSSHLRPGLRALERLQT